MSQPRKPRTRSRRGSSEGDTENCSEALLPETVIEAAKKSSRKRVIQDKSRTPSARLKARKDKLTIAEQTDSSNDSDSFKQGKDEETVERPESPQASEPEGQPLVLDDLIDDFGDEELEDSESVEENTQLDIDTDNEDSSQLVLELVEDSDEEVENEIAEEMDYFEPSIGNKCKFLGDESQNKIVVDKMCINIKVYYYLISCFTCSHYLQAVEVREAVGVYQRLA